MKTALPAIVVLLSLTSALSAQPGDETGVVLRISRAFIHDLTGVRFQRDEPIATNNGGAQVTGHAHVTGTFNVTLEKSEHESNFDLHIDGDVATEIVATRRPVCVFTHGDAPFSAGCRISFDGHTFSRQAVQVNVRNQFVLDRLGAFRGGVAGAFTRAVARPVVRRSLREGEQQAAEQIAREVHQSFDGAADRLVASLNKIEPIAKLVRAKLAERGLATTTGLQLYRAATEDYLWLSIGKEGARMARLPAIAEVSPIELWINEQDARLKKLADEYRANLRPIVLERVARSAPELSQVLLRATRVETVEGWRLVRVTPDTSKLKMPTIDLP